MKPYNMCPFEWLISVWLISLSIMFSNLICVVALYKNFIPFCCYTPILKRNPSLGEIKKLSPRSQRLESAGTLTDVWFRADILNHCAQWEVSSLKSLPASKQYEFHVKCWVLWYQKNACFNKTLFLYVCSKIFLFWKHIFFLLSTRCTCACLSTVLHRSRVHLLLGVSDRGVCGCI